MAKKKKSQEAEVEAVDAEMIEPEPPTSDAPAAPPAASHGDLFWKIGCGVITALAIFLRFFELTLKPLHHDEGVNGFFLKNLVVDGAYKYDPANYHGPSLYYISLAFVNIFGLNTWAVRASVAIFGVLTVVLVFYLRRYLGTIGTLAAAMILALSPGMVFISRYFIHEIFFVFLSLAVVVAVVLFIEKRRAGPMATAWMALILLVCFMPSAVNLAAYLGGTSATAVWLFRIGFLIVDVALVYQIVKQLLAWDEGRPIYLLLAAASVSLIFATKETGFITLGTMAIACLSVWMWRGVLNSGLWKQNAFKAIAGAHVVVLLVLLMSRESLADGYRSLTDSFFSSFRPAEPFVFYSIFALILGSLAAWGLFLNEYRSGEIDGTDEPASLTWPAFRTALGDSKNAFYVVIAAAGIFAYLGILFFSSFFTYAEGINKAFEAYAIWSKTGSKDHTQNGTFAYLKWGMKIESPMIILSALGILIALLKPKHRFAMFTAFWAGGLFLAYTIIPYKTPWLALSFMLPMCLIAGYGIGQLIESGKAALKIPGIALAVLAVAVLGYQSQQLNFVRYDDDDEPYVYAHTKRGFLDLVNEIYRYADKSGKGKDATIEIVSPDYWPMTWYMNDYSHANFYGSLIDATTSEMIVAKKDDQDAEVMKRYASHYKYVGVYPLRPGVNLVLLVRNDLADPSAQEVYKLSEYKPIQGYTK